MIISSHLTVRLGTQVWATETHDVSVSGLRLAAGTHQGGAVTVSLGLSVRGIDQLLTRAQGPSDLVYISHTTTSEVLFIGRVTSFRRTADRLDLSVASLATLIDQSTSRVRYTRECRFAFGSAECTLSGPGVHASTPIPAPIAVNHSTLVPWGAASLRFKNGALLDAEGKHYTILDIFDNPKRLLLDKPLTTTPTHVLYGCGKTYTDCQAWLNTVNFGGFPWVPDKNPMTGQGVF